MSWLHLGRGLGAVVLIGGLPAIMMAMSAPEPVRTPSLLSVAACMIGAFWLVIRCDRALRRRQAHYAGKEEVLGQEFSQAQLLVGMLWPRWLLTVALFLCMGVLAVMFGATHRSRDPVLSVVVVALVLSLLAIALWTHGSQAVRAFRCGYLLRVDQLGFHVVGEFFVPWPKVHDAAVRHGNFLKLQLVVDPSAAVALKGREGELPWQWGRPVVAAHGRLIQVPLRLLDVSPRFLEGAVYALCKRYAGQEFWDRNAAARSERELEAISRRLEALNSIRLQDILKMPVAKQEEILQAGLDAVDELRFPEKVKTP